MNTRHGSMILATAMLLPVATVAAPLVCPSPAEVFAKDDGSSRPIAMARLADQVGTAALDVPGVQKMKKQIQSDFPKATLPEVADLLITAFCTYLQKDTPESREREASVAAYEKLVYGVVFAGPAPSDYKRQGWLYSE